MDIYAFKKKEWQKWLESIDDGPNIMQFQSANDMDSLRAVISRVNVSGKTDTRYSYHMYRKQLIGNIFKIPLKPIPKQDMTREDVLKLEKMRFMKTADMTDELISSFETEEGRRKAITIKRMREGDRILRIMGISDRKLNPNDEN